MKTFGLIATVIMIGQVAGVGIAQAATTTDSYVNVSTGGLLSGVGSSLGNTTYQLQEGVYQTTNTTIPHDYIWVGVDGSYLLAVDPPKPVITR